jgi:hypothetical protein
MRAREVLMAWITLHEAIQQFFIVARADPHRKWSLGSLRRTLALFLRVTGNLRMIDLSSDHLRLFVHFDTRRMQASGRHVPVQAVIGHYAVLRLFLAWCFASHLIPFDPEASGHRAPSEHMQLRTRIRKHTTSVKAERRRNLPLAI